MQKGYLKQMKGKWKMEKVNKLMNWYFLFHVVFSFVFILWYFLNDVYFGYELGDILIILCIILVSVISIILCIIRKKLIQELRITLLIFSIFFDTWLVILFITRN